MSRPLRVEFPGAIYHVMGRGVARTKTFLDDLDKKYFLKLVEKRVREGLLHLHAYTLMPNHFHLLCETPLAALGRIMQAILGSYAVYFNRRHDRVGHLWQGRYRAILVEDGKYFLDCSRYIHLNPQRAGLVPPADIYYWSSYGNFLGGRKPAVEWISKEKTLSYFANAAQYERFVQNDRNGPWDPFEQAIGGTILGSKQFVQKIRAVVREPREAESFVLGLRNIHRCSSAASTELFRYAVDRFFQDYSDCQKTRLFVYLLQKHTWLKGTEIARITQRTPGAVTHTRTAMEKRLNRDADLRRRLEQLESELPLRS